MINKLKDIEKYWTNRAEGYSSVNKGELATRQKDKWLNEIEKRLEGRDKNSISILDIGCGPGFFSIILANAGYKVTAIDYTEAMLEKARENSGELLAKINFMKMDAQNLSFEDESFDVVVSRNLTWDLEKPDIAYKEWIRVLKKQGVLLNFDANWYNHLFFEEKRKEYENDRKTAASKNIPDHYTCTDVSAMEEIAKSLPLSSIIRPNWDISILKEIGVSEVNIDYDIWKSIWSEEEKVNYSSTPMFLVHAIK